MELLLPIMLLALIALMIFQMSRQRKGMRQMQELQASLQPGDRVLTTAGLQAVVTETREGTVVLEIAPGVRTTWDRRVIRERLDADAGSGPAQQSGSSEAESL